MSREIKFRAWDKRAKSMKRVFRMRLNTDDAIGVEFWDSMEAYGKECELMQFTGLKDKNGKDIYEGDILRIFNEHYEVKFVQTDSGLQVDYGYPRKHNGPAPYWVEVIGNIYENPELKEASGEVSK